MIDVVTSFIDHLKHRQGVTGLTGERIYAGFAPQDEPRPYIVLTLISEAPVYHLLAPDTTRDSVIQVDCFAGSHADCVEVANAVEDSFVAPLDIDTLRIGSLIVAFGQVLTEAPTDNSDQWIFRCVRDYEITTSQPATTG